MRHYDAEKTREITNEIIRLFELEKKTLISIDIHIEMNKPIIVKTEELVFFDLIKKTTKKKI